MDPGDFLLNKISHFWRTVTVWFSEVIVRIKLVLQEDIMNGGYKRFLEGKNRELMFNGGRVSIGKDEQQQKKKTSGDRWYICWQKCKEAIYLKMVSPAKYISLWAINQSLPLWMLKQTRLKMNKEVSEGSSQWWVDSSAFQFQSSALTSLLTSCLTIVRTWTGSSTKVRKLACEL